MTSFGPDRCRDCDLEVIKVISAKTGQKIRLDPRPSPKGTFSVAVEHPGMVARHVAADQRGGRKDLWAAHASTCKAVERAPRRLTPRTLTLDLAGDEGTASEVALARTEAHVAEAQLERLAGDLIASWRERTKREGYFPIWGSVFQTFVAEHAELPRQMRSKFATLVGRKIHPGAAASYDRAHPQKGAA